MEHAEEVAEFASLGCSLDATSPSRAQHHSLSVGGSYGSAVIAWLQFDDSGVAECCYFVHCGASCEGGEGGDGERRGMSLNPLSFLVHLGGERHSNCRYFVLQRWQTCQQCFLGCRKQLNTEDSGVELRHQLSFLCSKLAVQLENWGTLASHSHTSGSPHCCKRESQHSLKLTIVKLVSKLCFLLLTATI